MGTKAEALAKYEPTNSLCGNVVLRSEHFFISYNPSPGMGYSVFAGDNGLDETAMYCRKNDKFYILNGDFREEYAELSEQGLDACLRFFAAHPHVVSSWSASVEEAQAALS